MGSELRSVWQAFHYEALWQMSWMRLNLILALLPVAGAVILYYGWRRLSILRWPLLVATGLLLPNAPYVVTDLIHLPGAIRNSPGPLYVVAGLILFVCLIATGVLSYAFTLHLMRKALRAAAGPGGGAWWSRWWSVRCVPWALRWVAYPGSTAGTWCTRAGSGPV